MLGETPPEDTPFTRFLSEAPAPIFGLFGLLTTPSDRRQLGRAVSSGAAGIAQGAGSAAQGAGNFAAGVGSGLETTGGSAGFLAGILPLLLPVGAVVVGGVVLYVAVRLATNPDTPGAIGELAKAIGAAKGGG